MHRLPAIWLVVATLSLSGAQAADWFPYPVQRVVPETAGADTPYVPLAKAGKSWRLCAALPHRKDDYWRAVEWGLVAEAQRVGVQVDVIYAGGYDQLVQQRRQLAERCQNGGYQAVILGALHEQALNEDIAALKAAGIPVIDLVNGVSSSLVAAKSLVSFHDMGAAAARYVNSLCARERKRYRIGWFPGPEGAGWVRTGDAGFRSALEPSCGEIVHTAFGDTGLRVQSEKVHAALQQRPDIDLIVGTAVTAEAASHELATSPHSRVRVIAYYLNASVFRGLFAGRILAAPTDSPVIQARIAIDLAIRILEEKPYDRQVGPRILLLDHLNIYNFHPDFALAPEDLSVTP